MYLKINLPPTKEQIEQAQEFIEYNKLCALVDGVYSRREMDYIFRDLITNRRGFAELGIAQSRVDYMEKLTNKPKEK
jgi:hypothetical protein